MHYPNFNEEKKLRKKGFKIIVGLDESGRGPLAGPVIASAVVITTAKIKNLPRTEPKVLVRGQKSPKQSLRDATGQAKIKNILKEVKDSKKLSSKKREELYKILIKHPAIKWGIGRVSEKVIDKINILEATKLAMIRAIEKLKIKKLKIDYLILDGNFKIESKIPQKSIVKADEKVFSCAAASIIAKVTRDKTMVKYHKKYPKYGFDKHKGYPTKKHRELLKKHGPCEIHRQSFKPVILLKFQAPSTKSQIHPVR